MKKATMADVAKLAGVSKSTVSQYINNRFTYMSEPTKKTIKKAVEELRYVPNFTAKSLKQKRTKTIGVIVANILHTFSNEVIRSIEDECEKYEFQMIVCNADENPEKESNYINSLLSKQVDGLIIFPTTKNDNALNYLKQLNFPVVLIDRTVKGNFFPSILLDNKLAAEIAVDTLYRNGVTEIGVVSPPFINGVTPRVERRDGYRNALVERNLIINEEWIIQGNSKEIRDHLNNLYSQQSLPNAFFAINDFSLIELLSFLKSKALRIPKDVNVIAMDDSTLLEFTNPPITVIKQPTFEMGRAAARRLLGIIEKKERMQQEYKIERFAPALITRNSIRIR